MVIFEYSFCQSPCYSCFRHRNCNLQRSAPRPPDCFKKPHYTKIKAKFFHLEIYTVHQGVMSIMDVASYFNAMPFSFVKSFKYWHDAYCDQRNFSGALKLRT